MTCKQFIKEWVKLRHSTDRLSALFLGDLLNAVLVGRLHLASIFLVATCELSSVELIVFLHSVGQLVGLLTED